MIEIIILMILVIMMAKRRGGGRRRAMAGYIKLPFQQTQDQGAISADAFAGFNLQDVVSERTWVSSVKAVYGLQDFTVGEGPAVLYVAHSDYTDAEVAEYINSVDSWDTGNLVAREQAARKVRMIGIFALRDQGEEILNDGKPLTTKVGMMLDTGDTLQYGLFAAGGTITTGAILTAVGHANGWKR